MNKKIIGGNLKEDCSISPVSEIVEDLKKGRMVILIDDQDRENEGDLLIAADFVSAETINFMAKFGRGLICLTLTREHCEKLKLPLMVADNSQGTAFTVSIEASSGVTTGISAADRAYTILRAVRKEAKPEDLKQPGHVFPLMARDGGVLSRAGHTEAGCDLARLAGLPPFSVICEIMNDDGTMARLPDLIKFSREHKLKIGTIADLIEYRSQTESLLELRRSFNIETDWGGFEVRLYQDLIEKQPHLALIKGSNLKEKVAFIRVHEPFTVLDALPLGGNKNKSWTFESSMRKISSSDCGAFVMLNCARSSNVFFASLKKFEDDVERRDGKSSRTLRNYGLGAAILRDIGIRRMIVLSEKLKIPSMNGYGLEVVDYLPPGRNM